jgi:hypothetical protein
VAHAVAPALTAHFVNHRVKRDGAPRRLALDRDELRLLDQRAFGEPEMKLLARRLQTRRRGDFANADSAVRPHDRAAHRRRRGARGVVRVNVFDFSFNCFKHCNHLLYTAALE